jgi:hypothetical protein
MNKACGRRKLFSFVPWSISTLLISQNNLVGFLNAAGLEALSLIFSGGEKICYRPKLLIRSIRLVISMTRMPYFSF